MIPGATPSTPTREDSERLLSRGVIGDAIGYHLLAALLRIEDAIASRSDAASRPEAAPVVAPRRKRAA
jgi:hypothetical protein